MKRSCLENIKQGNTFLRAYKVQKKIIAVDYI